MTTYFKRLRKQLPRNYLVKINEKVPELSPRQIRAVFNGEITNPDIVDKVISGAIKVHRVTNISSAKILQRLQGLKKNYRSVKRAA